MIDSGSIAITAFISPFIEDRIAVRNLMPLGDFIEIYCKASLETCEARDIKGFYKRARKGEIKNYTGIDSPYEQPKHPELTLDTELLSINDAIEIVLKLLVERGVIISRLQ